MAEEFNKYKRNTLNTEYIEDKFSSSSSGGLCELVHIDDSNIKEVFYKLDGGFNNYVIIVDCPNVYLESVNVDMNSTITFSYRGLADIVREEVALEMDGDGKLDSVLEGRTKLFPFQYWPCSKDEYYKYRADFRLDYLGNMVRYNGIDDLKNKGAIASISSNDKLAAGFKKYEGPFDLSLMGGAFGCWTYPAAYKELGY